MSTLRIKAWGYALVAFKERDPMRGYEIVGSISVLEENETIGAWVTNLLATEIAHETSKSYVNEQAPEKAGP